jgi:hypothetical protein
MLIEILKMRFPSVFGQSRQHFTIDHLQEIKSILNNPPYHINYQNKTLTCTFDITMDLEYNKLNLDAINKLNLKNNKINLENNDIDGKSNLK